MASVLSQLCDLVIQKYLIPKAQRHSGVQADKLSIKEDALNILIKSYCRESGVRNLEKQIEKVRLPVLMKTVQTWPEFILSTSIFYPISRCSVKPRSSS